MNELLILTSIVVNLFFAFLLCRMSKGGIFAGIIINLLLVSIFGAKIVPFFGLITNVGTFFYPVVFIFITVLIEQFGKASAWRALWISFSALILFTTLTQFVIRLTPLEVSTDISSALSAIFSLTPRVTFASMFAYFISLSTYIVVYVKLKLHYPHAFLLRYVITTMIIQLLDSILFYTAAFVGVIDLRLVMSALMSGLLIKVLISITGGILVVVNPIFNIDGPQK